ncbi:transposase IS4 family protein [Streptomyces sp. 769]|nr:transposase IS4 family protein [Streptomyces sp. 769]
MLEASDGTHWCRRGCFRQALRVLANRAHRGVGGVVRTPGAAETFLRSTLEVRRVQPRARLSAWGGRTRFTRLKQWRILCKTRYRTNRIGRTVAAVHTIEMAW